MSPILLRLDLFVLILSLERGEETLYFCLVLSLALYPDTCLESQGDKNKIIRTCRCRGVCVCVCYGQTVMMGDEVSETLTQASKSLQHVLDKAKDKLQGRHRPNLYTL